jgi:hypothetical protein
VGAIQTFGLERLMHLASFALGSLPLTLRQLVWRPDVVWVVEPPLFCAPTALLVARLCGARVAACARLRVGCRICARRVEGLPNAQTCHLDLQPMERFNELLGLTDIHLLPQRADAAELVMPSKLTGMLASGRAVAATAHPDTELGKAVTACGIRAGRPAPCLD